MPGFHSCPFCELGAEEAFDGPNAHWEEITQRALKKKLSRCVAEAGFELSILPNAWNDRHVSPDQAQHIFVWGHALQPGFLNL